MSLDFVLLQPKHRMTVRAIQLTQDNLLELAERFGFHIRDSKALTVATRPDLVVKLGDWIMVNAAMDQIVSVSNDEYVKIVFEEVTK